MATFQDSYHAQVPQQTRSIPMPSVCFLEYNNTGSESLDCGVAVSILAFHVSQEWQLHGVNLELCWRRCSDYYCLLLSTSQ